MNQFCWQCLKFQCWHLLGRSLIPNNSFAKTHFSLFGPSDWHLIDVIPLWHILWKKFWCIFFHGKLVMTTTTYELGKPFYPYLYPCWMHQLPHNVLFWHFYVHTFLLLSLMKTITTVFHWKKSWIKESLKLFFEYFLKSCRWTLPHKPHLIFLIDTFLNIIVIFLLKTR